jgi:thiamine-phosphate pyrophosphorylase
MPPTAPRLLAVSDRHLLAGVSWEVWCAGLAAAGADALQIRERDLDDLEVYELACSARHAFPAPGRVFVNRRFDLALAAGADGVHLPASGLPTRAVRAHVPAGFLVGRSTHALDEVRAARDQGADFVLFGPVHSTPSKAGRLAPRGLAALRAAAELGVPVLAIGGVAAENVVELRAAGAWGVAAIRAFATPATARALVAAFAAGEPR